MKLITLLLATVLAVPAFGKANKPKTAEELANVTVMVTNKAKNSGGSGVIYRSSNKGSYILTNSHVCEVAEKGGLIVTNKAEYTIEQYKRSQVHDICVIKVIADLKQNVQLSESSLNFGDALTVSGHPYLLPTTITNGSLSGAVEITLLIGMDKCKEKDYENNGFYCSWFGGIPIIKNYPAQTTSVMIAPGNSGSGVFNASGELVGLAFAGIGRGISHGMIVPAEYIRAFIANEVKTLKWSDANAAKRVGMEGDEESYGNTRYARPSTLTTQTLDKVTFPAIKDAKTESLIQKVDLCRTNLGKCK